jgi:hypothetical protein
LAYFILDSLSDLTLIYYEKADSHGRKGSFLALILLVAGSSAFGPVKAVLYASLQVVE